MHAFAHAKATMHFVVMNRTTSMIWCYACDSEVLESDVLPDEYNARLGEYRALVLPPQRGNGGGSSHGGGHIVEAAIAARKVVIGTRRESDPRTPLVAKYPVTGGLTGLGNVRSLHHAAASSTGSSAQLHANGCTETGARRAVHAVSRQNQRSCGSSWHGDAFGAPRRQTRSEHRVGRCGTAYRGSCRHLRRPLSCCQQHSQALVLFASEPLRGLVQQPLMHPPCILRC